MTAPEALPHDLLELAAPDVLAGEGPLPAWAASSLALAPFVVVRRAPRRGALIPVGVRGSTRSERAAAWLPASAVRRRLGPEDLAARPRTGLRPLPALVALDPVSALLSSSGLAWGPTGSVGFELATGIAAVRPSSDLDVLVRASRVIPRERARALQAGLASLPCRVDVQLETPGGAVALAEYGAGARRLLARTDEGPRLIEDPWPE